MVPCKFQAVHASHFRSRSTAAAAAAADEAYGITAFELGWMALDNGALLAAAEAQFDALVTTDQNLRYQQNLAGRTLAILVLPTTSWPRIQAHCDQIAAALDTLRPGDFVELRFT